MPTRIFRVDLSEGARDFKPVATEPGLPMLDRAGANNTILHRWLGNLAAEPVWIAEDSINVFAVGDEGRLDKVDLQPATKADLEGPLAQDLKTLQARIKKAKPESATEQSLHRVVRQTVAQLANDLESGGQDSFFFKYRKGKDPWKLVWCWGYQRTDLEPAPAAVCTNPECHQLFVKRPQNKNRCPNCDEVPSNRRGGSGGSGGGAFSSRWVQIGGLAALLLLALGLLFFFGGRSQLVVTPSEISGPAGSRINYKVMARRFFVFNNDVTSKAQAQMHDVKLVEFAPDKGYALARKTGKTMVEFELSGSKIKTDISIGPPATPKRIVIEPNSVRVGVGEKKQLKATGFYDDDVKIDLTDFAEWDVENGIVGYCGGGEAEGYDPGKTNIVCKYRSSASDKHATATIPMEVALPPGTLAVSPSKIYLAVDESLILDINTSDTASITVESSDPKVIEVLPGYKVIGRGAGLAEITVKQGDRQQTVRARVSATPYRSLHIVPAVITLKTGEPGKFKVVGRDAEGKDTEIPPDKLIWLKQPLAEHMNLKHESLEIYGLTPTPTPLEMAVQFGDDLVATAKYEVLKGAKGSTTIIGEFMPYPPIEVGTGTVVVDQSLLGKGLVYSDDGGIIVRDIDSGSQFYKLGIPKGALITGVDDGVNKIGFEGLGVKGMREYLTKNKFRKGHRLQYIDPKTKERKVVVYDADPVGVREVAFAGAKPVESTAVDFRAEVAFDVREKAEYRVVDSADKPLSEWETHGPMASVKVVTSKISRVAGDEYELWIERKLGGAVKKFQAPFKLEVENK